MGGLFTTIKKFFINKTTVTFLGIVVGLAVLVGFYMYRVNTAVSPTKVPVAKHDLNATDEITRDDIEYVKISSKFLNKADVYTEKEVDTLINHYVATGTSIPKGGMFYKTQVVEKKELPNSIFDEIPDGYTIYQLKVDNISTYANSIFPGDKIDLYLKTEVDGQLVFGKFITNIEVLAVRDNAGQNVFDVTSGKTPAWLLFAVKTDLYRYLKIAEFASNMQIIPVPVNNLYEDNVGSTEYTDDQLIKYIENLSMRMEG